MFQTNPIMGILNVTPDSFSDGGDYTSSTSAINHAKELIKNGVDIIDIGGQSTRPGYIEVPFEEELQRVIPIIQGIRRFSDIPISIDTYFPEVAEAAIKAGASIINDVRGMDTPGMADIIAMYQVPVIIMHSRERHAYKSISDDLHDFYKEKITQCQALGIKKDHICFDPGIGFYKSVEDNQYILSNPDACRYKDYPLLYGVSRKRTIAQLIQEVCPKERDFGTVSASLYAIQKGVDIVRVHNVKGMHDALSVWRQLDNLHS